MMKYNSECTKLHERNFRKYGLDMNLNVSLASFLVVILFAAFVLIGKDTAADCLYNIRVEMTERFNVWFVVILNITLLFVILLGVSRLGKIRIGGKNARKEYSNIAWYSMLFSAGIGIGIFFYGIAEPIYHLSIPEGLTSVDAYSPFRVMYLHWGFHAWAVYAVVAIAIGYFSYSLGMPISIRSVFYPILKDKIYGIIGDIIDTVAVLSVLFGLSTSLGLGASQINAGLNFVFGISISNNVQLLIIGIITFVATLSVVSGISRGIRFLSIWNVRVSLILLGFILVMGPTIYILNRFLGGFSSYMLEIVHLGTFVGSSRDEVVWQSGWTIFYWAWWFSWSPFVGMFIARISKGRTVREMVTGTVLLPSIVCFFTMTILGASGLYYNEVNSGIMTEAINNNLSTSLFVLLGQMFGNGGLNIIVSNIAISAIVLFFVTSSDSGSLVVDFLTSGGNANTPKTQRVFWAVMEGAIAASVLVLGGKMALSSLQAVVIIMGLPFSVMFVVMIYSIIKSLQEEIT